MDPSSCCMKVSEIAPAVGYDSVDHFSRTFRRVYGMSPRRQTTPKQMKNRSRHKNKGMNARKTIEVSIREGDGARAQQYL